MCPLDYRPVLKFVGSGEHISVKGINLSWSISKYDLIRSYVH